MQHGYEERCFNGVWYYKDWETKRWVVMTPNLLLVKLATQLSHMVH